MAALGLCAVQVAVQNKDAPYSISISLASRFKARVREGSLKGVYFSKVVRERDRNRPGPGQVADLKPGQKDKTKGPNLESPDSKSLTQKSPRACGWYFYVPVSSQGLAAVRRPLAQLHVPLQSMGGDLFPSDWRTPLVSLVISCCLPVPCQT